MAQKKTGRGWSLLKGIFLLATNLSALMLLGADAAAYVHPEKFWVFAFLGLGFPVLLAVNVFFFFFWMVVRLRYVFIPLLAIVFGWFQLTHAFAWHNPLHENKSGDLKVMSWNVRNFDLYNWNHNKETRSKMFQLIKDEQPDVACFQEFYSSDAGDFQNEKMLMKDFGFTSSYFYKAETLHGTDHWGVAIFSKLPIVNSGVVPFQTHNMNVAIYADVVWKADTIRVYTTHLQSIYLGDKDYQYLETVQDSGDVNLKESKHLYSKIKPAFITRAKQADELKKQMNNCRYPKILCGDFNDTPSGYAYHTLQQNMQDAFLKTNFGIGSTYNGNIPLLRIDYILCDENFTVNSFDKVTDKLSDHFPVMATFSVK